MATIDTISPTAAATIASAVGGINFAGRKPFLEVMQIPDKLDALIAAQQATLTRLDTLIAALADKAGA